MANKAVKAANHNTRAAVMFAIAVFNLFVTHDMDFSRLFGLVVAAGRIRKLVLEAGRARLTSQPAQSSGLRSTQSKQI